MRFSSPLQSGILIKRYKRFLADVVLDNGKIITVHCANTGAMTGCANSGDRVWFSTSNNPKRKLPYSWELTETKDNFWICVNTIKANHIVKEAILQNEIPEFIDYQTIHSEVKYGDEKSRIDLLLTEEGLPNCYIEVKSVTLFEPSLNRGFFPDAVTTRGQKHLRELTMMVQNGYRSVLFFLVLHSGIDLFSPATHIDPVYSKLLIEAVNAGVEVICYKTTISTQEIKLETPIPVMLDQ